MRQEFCCEVLRHNAPSHFTAASPKPKLMITASTKQRRTEKIFVCLYKFKAFEIKYQIYYTQIVNSSGLVGI